MKHFFAITLISFLLFHVGSSAFMNVWFYVSNQSFEKAFCVNLASPKKDCHGSCMMKKINKAPKEKNDLSRFAFYFQGNLSDYLLSKCINIGIGQHMDLIKPGFMYFFNYFKLKNFQIFQPPEKLLS